MNIRRVRPVYFSPTGTSKSIAEAVAEGIGMKTDGLNLTRSDDETPKREFSNDELAIIASPVYGGRIPVTAADRFKNLKGNGTPAVLVVVYGNRAYDNALLELKDLAIEQGFIPIAGAAFIGEHSYSTAEKPIAAGRPDGADLKKALAFGVDVKEKLKSAEGGFRELEVPGKKPFRERGIVEPFSPETDRSTCSLCGTCATVCPTAAVIVAGLVETMKERCIRCSACVKNCPTGARHWEHEGLKRAVSRLYENCSVRKEPELFL